MASRIRRSMGNSDAHPATNKQTTGSTAMSSSMMTRSPTSRLIATSQPSQKTATAWATRPTTRLIPTARSAVQASFTWPVRSRRIAHRSTQRCVTSQIATIAPSTMSTTPGGRVRIDAGIEAAREGGIGVLGDHDDEHTDQEDLRHAAIVE